MTLEEKSAIIEQEFTGIREQLVYCPHCLKPFKPNWLLDEQNREFEDYCGPFDRQETMERLLQKILGEGVTGPDNPPPHACDAHCRVDRSVKTRTTADWNRLENGESGVIFCPECHTAIHRGEGPLDVPGYRSELLERLFPGS